MGLCGWANELMDGRCGWVDELVVGWMDGGWSCGRVAGLVSLASCQQGAEG